MIATYLIYREPATGQISVIRPVNDDGSYGAPVDVANAAFIAWNAAQPTPDDLLTHPPQPTTIPPSVQAAITALKAYQALSGQGTAAQIDTALKAQIILDRYLAQALLT